MGTKKTVPALLVGPLRRAVQKPGRHSFSPLPHPLLNDNLFLPSCNAPPPLFRNPGAQDLEALKVEGKSPCGMVTVTLTGQQMPLSCDISEEAMAEGAKVLGEKVRSAA